MPDVSLNAGASMEIGHLAPLQRLWLGQMEKADSIVLNLAAVERIDTAGLQFLLSVSREAKLRQLSFRFEHAGELVLSQADALGLGREFV